MQAELAPLAAEALPEAEVPPGAVAQAEVQPAAAVQLAEGLAAARQVAAAAAVRPAAKAPREGALEAEQAGPLVALAARAQAALLEALAATVGCCADANCADRTRCRTWRPRNPSKPPSWLLETEAPPHAVASSARASCPIPPVD